MTLLSKFIIKLYFITMNRYLIILVVMAIGFASCSKVPVTDRRQLNLLPESQMLAMSLTAYNDFLTENNVVESSSNTQAVQRVGNNIAEAATAYLRANKQTKRVKDFNWEFNLVQDDLVNAWAMPGGKVVFYTGILPITQTENGMAVVMGHEVAHAIARHGNERMSQGLSAQLGGLALAVAMSQKPQQTQDLFNQAYGVGAQVGMLGFSRKHESEADKMGLVFMAMAGYDPNEAVPFWGRMAEANKGAQPPEFLSTHPSHETRIEDLRAFMPKALGYFDAKNPAANSKNKTTVSNSNKSNTNTTKPSTTRKPTNTNTNTNKTNTPKAGSTKKGATTNTKTGETQKNTTKTRKVIRP